MIVNQSIKNSNGLIPGFIHTRNELARSCDLNATSRIEKDMDEDELQVISTWTGNENSFRAIGLLTRCMKAPKRCLRISHYLQNDYSGYLSFVDIDSYEFEFTEQAAISIEVLEGAIEYSTYENDYSNKDIQAWYGKRSALREVGILKYPVDRWKRKRSSGSIKNTNVSWSVIKYPNDYILYSLKTFDRDRFTQQYNDVQKTYTPESYKEEVIFTAETVLSTLLAWVNGGIKGNSGLRLSNADFIMEQGRSMMENIRAARVVKKPKLKLVKSNEEVQS